MARRELPPMLGELATCAPRELRHRDVVLGDTARKALLEKVRAGEAATVTFDATTFIQREAPNRNFVRVKPAALGRLAKSFPGVPFLRDHDQRSLEARGGTVKAAELVKNGDEASIAMTIEVVKPWAVEGLLDGTIDRFSVGFLATDDIICSVHKTPIFAKCSCWPGDPVGEDSDERVEFVYTGAEGVEVSAVNVPAVTGTGIDGQVRQALLALQDSNRGAEPHRETTMKRVLERLGLSEAASEEHALAALDKLNVELEAGRQRLKTSEGKLAELEAERRAHQAQRVDGDIEQLYESGRLPIARDVAGKRVAHELEKALRNMAGTVGYEAFKAYADTLPVIAPVGASALRSALGEGAPRAGGMQAPTAEIDQAAVRLGIDPAVMRETLAKAAPSVTDEMAVKFGPKQGV